MRDVEDCTQVLESLAVKEIVGFGKISCHGFRHVVLHDPPHAPIVGGSWLRLSRDWSGGEELTLRHPGNRENAAHTFSSEIWVVQEPSAVREDEQFGEVRHRAGAFLSPDHSKVALVAV